jgi:hypothetical protein
MRNRKLVLYIDTSVIGGYFDVEFEVDTKMLFESVLKNEFDIMFSNITENELLNAPEQVRQLLSNIPERNKIRIELMEEAVQLADTYISENVVGKTSRDDCFHIVH